MPLRLSLAARITVGDLAAICSAIANAAARSSTRGDDRVHGTEVVQLLRGGGRRRVHHRPHLVLRHEPAQVGGGTERAAVDLGKAEGGVVGGDDHVGVADQPDPAAEAVAVDGRDHRHRAVVHGREGGEAARGWRR